MYLQKIYRRHLQKTLRTRSTPATGILKVCGIYTTSIICRWVDYFKASRPHQKTLLWWNDTKQIKPHTSLVICLILLTYGLDKMSNPVYSADLTPSDYHLLRALGNSLNCKIFNDENTQIKLRSVLFADKDQV